MAENEQDNNIPDKIDFGLSSKISRTQLVQELTAKLRDESISEETETKLETRKDE